MNYLVVIADTIELLDSGKYRLYEKWSWTTGKEGIGESIIEEV